MQVEFVSAETATESLAALVAVGLAVAPAVADAGSPAEAPPALAETLAEADPERRGHFENRNSRRAERSSSTKQPPTDQLILSMPFNTYLLHLHLQMV